MQSTPAGVALHLLESPAMSTRMNGIDQEKGAAEGARPVWMLVASPVVVAVGASAIGDAVALDPIRLTAGSADVLTIAAATSSVLP